jgi:hypothetical protein
LLINEQVFVVVTKHIEMATVDLDELLMYMLKLMDETVGDEMGYTMVICYTEVTDDNVPPTAWIREVYDLLPRKCVALRCLALPCVALRCLALPCVALRCVASITRA